MSAEDKTNLDVLSNNYISSFYSEVPYSFRQIGRDASGNVVIGPDITKRDIMLLGIPGTDTTYQNATQTSAGLMSIDDKNKLDNLVPATFWDIEVGADNTRVMTPLRVKQAIERYGYITINDLDGYVTDTDLNNYATLENLNDYATLEDLSEIIGITGSLEELINSNVVRYN